MMLQGNPFEVELHVKERTEMVHTEVDQTRRSESTAAGMMPQRRRLPVLRPMRAWWVPAAFAAGLLTGLAWGGI